MITIDVSSAGSLMFCKRRGTAVGQRHSQTLRGRGMFLTSWLAKVMELDVDAIAHLPERIVGERDAARLGQRFQPRGDIDALFIDILPLGDDVAEVRSHAKSQLPIAFCRTVPLPGQRALDGIDHASELRQIAVAHPLDNAALVLGDGRFDDDGTYAFSDLRLPASFMLIRRE